MKITLQIRKKRIVLDFGLILILMIFFATSVLAIWTSFNFISGSQGSFYLMRQILWYSLGFIILVLMHFMSLQTILRYVQEGYRILLILLAYLLASRILYLVTSSLFANGISLPLAAARGGSFAWLNLPFGLGFQPSEFMKVILLIQSALIITDYKKSGSDKSIKDDLLLLFQLLKNAAIPLLLILFEPDTGVFLIILATILLLYLCSGIHRIILTSVLVTLLFAVFLFFYLFFFHKGLMENFIPAYQLARIEAWLNPEAYIQGSSNQLYTALLALGSSGLFGYGFQANVIAIPEAHTDFIFASFGECFGLVGTTYLLLLCLCLDLYLCRLAYNARNNFARYLTLGTMIMLLYQQIQNLGMIIGLLPITGITLPLISYGGSSSLSYFILFGMILVLSPVSKRRFRFRLPFEKSS